MTRLCELNDDYFNHLYHLTLEKIRKFYYKKNGFPEIPTSKVLDFYKDDTYSKTIYKITPPAEFIELYYATLNEQLSNKEKMECLLNLYEYSKGEYDIDKKQNRVLIKSKYS